MTRKRKRHHAPNSEKDATSKRLRIDDLVPESGAIVRTRLLSFYYPNVQTLAEYLLQRLGSSSSFTERVAKLSADDDIAYLLKSTLVGSFKTDVSKNRAVRARDFQEFSQGYTGSVAGTRRTSGGISSTLGDGLTPLPDLIEFAIWQLFFRTYRHALRPPHALCNGFFRTDAPRSTADQIAARGGIHGLSTHRANAQVDRLKYDDWVALLQLMGKDGDYIMLDLLLDCGLFVPVSAGKENYLQLSGVNVSELPTLDQVNKATKARLERFGHRAGSSKTISPRLPSQISFVRSRMFYARAALNGKGDVHFGLRHIHVLNRFPDSHEESHTTHVMKYVFPRQFGLHNVFTSQVDKRETAHTFKDYTLREQEISNVMRHRGKRSTPKRLRGECFNLIRKLQTLHRRCAYKELLKHYCPFPELDRPSKARKRRKNISVFATQVTSTMHSPSKFQNAKPRSLVDLATPTASVSAFIRAVIGNMLPKALLGSGPEGEANIRHLGRSIDQFIHGKRFENISLDSVCHGIKIASIDWLRPPNTGHSDKLCKTDFLKRSELIQELMYYIFDSLIIPLVRSNFHVTESNEHRYRLFYFRHDVWKLATEPAITQLRSKMYQELPLDKAQAILTKSPLGFSQVRLLPKKATARPIINLKRRPVIKRNGRTYLGASINSTLRNVFSMLNYEKLKQPELLGSAIFSVDEVYPRIQAFKQILSHNGLSEVPLYFVKVDVQSCFDTIPQQAILELVEDICQHQSFTVKHHARVKAVSESGRGHLGSSGNRKPTKKFQAIAHAESSSQGASFPELVEAQYACSRKAEVFVEGSLRDRVESEDLLDLLDDHISRNIVRIGKKYYRQKNGIPQGSVVSSLLCSFFYGDFERKRLSFLRDRSDGTKSMLVRLIDDFLLITTDRKNAEDFLHTMLKGDPEYGISVKAEKTLLNFIPSVDCDVGSPATQGFSARFPWCGTFVDTKTLALFRDRRKASGIGTDIATEAKGGSQPRRKVRFDLADSITTEAIRRPGAAFYRKTLAAVRLNVRDMYTDTAMAGVGHVRDELLEGMMEVAEKAVRYLARLRSVMHTYGKRQEIASAVIKRTIEDTAKLVTVLTKDGATGKQHSAGYKCALKRKEIKIVVIEAFASVMHKQQTRYGDLLTWLQQWREALQED